MRRNGENMIEKCKKLLEKYREIIIYLIVGVLTTIVSFATNFVFERFLMDPEISWQNFIINTSGWVAGVLFAYPLNRVWVFKSKNAHVVKEFFGFALSRVSTWILDVVIMWLTVNVFGMGFWIAKIFISSVLVTIANYVFSKVLIFKKK